MINLLPGSLFDTDAEALVNTVNTVGVMGKGIALQFKERFPQNFDLYAKACERGDLHPGKMLLTETGQLTNPRYIINFPTKKHWREKSKLWYIDQGLSALVEVIDQYQIRSVALPPLGCGNGGLDWQTVKPLIEQRLGPLAGVTVYLFEPSEVAYQRPRKRDGRPPTLTTTRALVLHSLYRYQQKGYTISLLEIQKLVYFLQRLDIHFKNLTFTRGLYGPYAQPLQHAINDLDGYYLDGMKYGDAKPHDLITLRNEHLPAIQAYIEAHFSAGEKEALAVIDQLIEGFETPLGLEMLATLDFLIQEQPTLRGDSKALIQAAHAWNERKAQLMKPQYLTISLQRLEELSHALYPDEVG
jgi:O-acetyl-ADP-ribose deacetylase (regulator of RNase III)